MSRQKENGVARHAEKPQTEMKSPSANAARSNSDRGAPSDNSGQEAATPERSSQAAPPLKIDDSGAAVCYANFCRVTATPEELTIDLGFNHEAFKGQPQRVAVAQRVVVNYYTAKRMLHALSLAVGRHEAVFGVLETDVRRRMRAATRGPAGQPRPSAAQPQTGPPLQKAG